MTLKQHMAIWVALSGFAAGALGGPCSSPVGAQSAQVPPVVSITMTRFGPSPQTIKVTAHPFLLVIHTHWLGMGDAFSLLPKHDGAAQEDSKPLVCFQPQDHKNVDSSVIDLQAGEYELQFSQHPEWTVSVHVAPVRQGNDQ